MPNSFANLTWLQQPWQQLQNSWQNIKTTQAFLFIGAGGIGKHLFCEQLSKLLLCENPQNNQHCDQCLACKMMQKQEHLDYIHIKPSPNIISIDTIRSLNDFISNSSYRDSKKVIYIEKAEQLNIQAANSLLKMLEEPNDNCVFILSSNQHHRLLPTIISRTLPFNLPKPSFAQAYEWLDKLPTSIAKTDLHKLISYSNNCPFVVYGLMLANQHLIIEKTIQLVGTFLANKTAPILSQPMSQELRKHPLLIPDILIWILHNIAYAQLNSQLKEFMQTSLLYQRQWIFLLKSINTDICFGLIDKAYELRKMHLSGFSPNLELMINELLLDWYCHKNY